MRPLCLILAGVFISAAAHAQLFDPAQRAYETRCARCHGGDGTGGESGPNIVSQLGSRNDAELAAFLRSGRPASGMPAFDLAEQEMTALVLYLRTLAPVSRTQAPAVARRTVQTVDGRTLAGQVLSEGMSELQLRTDDKQIRLLRKQGDRYRVVTSQTDWPTYH